jgi:hypothetical protein
MNISDKDKQVLVYVVAALIVAAAFYFGFMNLNNKTQEYKSKAVQLEEQYNTLVDKQKNKAQYLADTAIYNENASKILNSYADGYSLENTIKYIYEMEDNTEIFIDSFSISDGSVSYSFSDGTHMGITIPISFNYEATYDTVKKLIDYINTFESKCAISSVSIDYDTDTDKATGAVSMNLYAVITSESVKPDIGLNMPTGNDNMFIATQAYESDATPQTGEEIIDDHDIEMKLIAPAANADTVSIGITGGDAPITSKVNDSVAVELVFGTTADGKYTVAYKIGDTTYPARNYTDGVVFEPGETIDVLVSSADLAGTDDKLTANVSIVNKTDQTVSVKVTGDETAKRFNIVEQSGKVRIYR